MDKSSWAEACVVQGTLVLLGVVSIMIMISLYKQGWRSTKKDDQSRWKIPPGTMGWPLLGETLDFISCAYSPRPESFMDKRRALYGKVFRSHIFGSPTVVSTDAEVSRAILQSDAKTFVPCYPKSVSELMGETSILLINGSLQRRVHGLIGSFFKSPQLKAQITQDMHEYVHKTLNSWCDGDIVNVQDEAKNIAFQVLVKALISLDPGEDMELLKQQFQKFISGLMSMPINFPGSQLYKSLQAKKRMKKLVYKVILERTKEKKPGAPKDVVDVLLSDKSSQLAKDLITNNIIDLMIPGEDSVPVLITLAVKFLTDCPLALQKLEEENIELKTRTTDTGQHLLWSDYISLPFTQNVITETLRMGNIIVGVMRKALRDVKIKGHLIPKDWCVLTYFRSIHLDEHYYEDAYQFNPWRWMDQDMMSASTFTPFGGGQRLCPGVDLSRLEASIFLHHLVTSFRWEAQEDCIVNFPTVRMKKGLPIRVVKKR